MGHIRGHSRHQTTLFPEALDDLIPPDHPVRVVDAFVNWLDLAELGFGKVESAATGRPPYHPAVLLKLYVYGYLNGIRSSRRLEKESLRNVELLWLLERLSPDFKTIANFRKDNRQAVVGACRDFVKFCRGQSLFGAELVAIDGSKFRAAASKKAVYSKARIERELARIERQVQEYLEVLDKTDASEVSVPDEGGCTAAALQALERRREELQAMAGDLRQRRRTHRVAGEADARLMRQAGGGHEVSYNVQTAVDAKHKLLVSHEVTDASNDRGQLYPMARAAQTALGAKRLTVVADAGYQNASQGQACEAAGVSAAVPKPRTVNPKGQFFTRDRFAYDARRDRYICPAGEALTVRRVNAKLQVRYYSTAACESCPLKCQCTRSRRRTINRHFYADAQERMHRRTVERPELLRQRACLSEHPFGSIKRMMEGGRFLMRGIENTRAEMGLSVLAYNLKRVSHILGVETLCTRLAQA